MEFADPDSADEAAKLDEVIASLGPAQIGDIGEETARAHLETFNGATIVSLGDAGMERHLGLQDLDIVALDAEGELIVYEVKTRYFAKAAGRLTAAGNLLRPRLTRGARLADGGRRPRQGSSAYTGARLEHLLEVDGEAELHVLLVDLRGRRIQEFGVDRDGRITGPVSEVEDCTEAMRMGLDVILGRRASS